MIKTEEINLKLKKDIFLTKLDFIKPIITLKDLPETRLPEIAFAGRSNVGKSSLINFIFQQKNLANSSSTPGRTQNLNFFLSSQIMHVVDMPGYGYAKAPKTLVDNWNKILKIYLQGRAQLKIVFLLIDSRHGIKPNDLEMMSLLDKYAVRYQIILTKIDKIKKNDLINVKQAVEQKMVKHPAMFPWIICSSAEKNIGLEELQNSITYFIQHH